VKLTKTVSVRPRMLYG